MITDYKITEIFCATDEFSKKFDEEIENMPLLTSDGKTRRRYANKVFAGLATDGKGTMGWCHGFKLHFICNDRGEIIMFCLTGANVDDRDPKVWAVLGKRIYGKLFADRGYISPNLFDALFADGVHLVTGIRNNMKNKLMPLEYDIPCQKTAVSQQEPLFGK